MAASKPYEHLCKMRDEIISLGIIPAMEDWGNESESVKTQRGFSDFG